MADLEINAGDVHVAHDGVLEKVSGPAAAAIEAGQAVYYDSNGKFALAQADAAGTAGVIGVAITSANAANLTIEVIRQGIVDLGDALDGVDFGDAVYLSAAAAGAIADAAPDTGGDQIREIGRVVPAWASTSGDKLLRVDVVDRGEEPA